MFRASSTGSEAINKKRPARKLIEESLQPRSLDGPPTQASEPLAPPFQIFFASQFATTKRDPNFENECTFRLPLITVPQYQAMRLLLKGFTIPVSWYIMTSYRNTLVYTLGGTTYTANIAPGNYNVTNFPAVFLAATGISLAFNSFTNKWQFSASSDFTFHSVSAGTTMFPFLGFVSYPSTSTTEYASSGGVLYSSIPVDFSGNNSIYVQTSFGTNNVGSIGETGLPSVSVIGRVPIPVQATGILNIDPNGYQVCEVTDRSITEVAITLLDEDLNVLQATLPWQMNVDVNFVWNPRNVDFGAKAIDPIDRMQRTSMLADAVTADVEMEDYDGEDYEVEPPPPLDDALAEAKRLEVQRVAEEALRQSERMRKRAAETYQARLRDDAKRGRLADVDALGQANLDQRIISLQDVDPFRNRAALAAEIGPALPNVAYPTSQAGAGPQNPGN